MIFKRGLTTKFSYKGSLQSSLKLLESHRRQDKIQNNSAEDPPPETNQEQVDKLAIDLRNLLMRGTVKIAKRAMAHNQKIAQKQVAEAANSKEQNEEKKDDEDGGESSEISSLNCIKEEEEFAQMDDFERDIHVQNLWKKAYLKARAGSQVIHFFDDLNRKIYLFGVSKKLEEIEKEEFIPRYILQPNSNIKSYWNIVNIILLLYTALFMPYRIAFIDDETVLQQVVDWSVDGLFFFDIIVTFFSAYEEADGYIQQNWKRIAITYIRSWFFLDLIACFPFQIFDHAGAETQSEPVDSQSMINYQKLIRLMRLPRLYRFLKIMKVLKQIKFLNNYKWYNRMMNKLKMNGGILRMVQGVIATVVITHLFACFWFLSAKIEDYDIDTWVYRMKLVDADSFTSYIVSLYWSVQTVITLGYGDIPAVTTIEILLCLVWMLFGEVFYSFIVATYTSIIEGNIQIDASIQNKIKSLTDLAQKAGIPFELSQKIKKFIENNYETLNNRDDESQIIKMLPPSLREELMCNTFGEVVDKVKFFKPMEDIDFIWIILPLLSPFKIEKQDVVYSKGDQADDIFYLVKGSVTLYSELGNPYIKYKDGDTLGDSDTLLNLTRDSKCLANTHLKVMVLKVTVNLIKDLKAHERNLLEMILMARKKRDVHKRLMIEADKKAAKDLMIQNLLKNKQLLYTFIAKKEKDMLLLTNKIRMFNHQMNNLRTENANLRITLQKTKQMQEKTRSLYDADYMHSYSESSERQQTESLFMKFFLTLQRAQKRAELINAQIRKIDSNNPYPNQRSQQQSPNTTRERRKPDSNFLSILVDQKSLGPQDNNFSPSVKNRIIEKKTYSTMEMYAPAKNSQSTDGSIEGKSPNQQSQETSKSSKNTIQASNLLSPKPVKKPNGKKRLTSNFPQNFNTDNIKPGEQSTVLNSRQNSSQTSNAESSVQRRQKSVHGDSVGKVSNSRNKANYSFRMQGSNGSKDIKKQVTGSVAGKSTASRKLKSQHTFGGNPFLTRTHTVSKQMIELQDVVIPVSEKLSILDRCLLSVYTKEEVGEIYEQFPYLLQITQDGSEESIYTFARQQYELSKQNPGPKRFFQMYQSNAPQKILQVKTQIIGQVHHGAGTILGSSRQNKEIGTVNESSYDSTPTPTNRTWLQGTSRKNAPLNRIKNNNEGEPLGQGASQSPPKILAKPKAIADFRRRSVSQEIPAGIMQMIQNASSVNSQRGEKPNKHQKTSSKIISQRSTVHNRNHLQFAKQKQSESSDSLLRENSHVIHIQNQEGKNAPKQSGAIVSRKSDTSSQVPTGSKRTSKKITQIINKDRHRFSQGTRRDTMQEEMRNRAGSVIKLKVRKLSFVKQKRDATVATPSSSTEGKPTNQFGNLFNQPNLAWKVPIVSPLLMQRILQEPGRYTLSPRKALPGQQQPISQDQNSQQNAIMTVKEQQAQKADQNLQEVVSNALEQLKVMNKDLENLQPPPKKKNQEELKDALEASELTRYLDDLLLEEVKEDVKKPRLPIKTTPVDMPDIRSQVVDKIARKLPSKLKSKEASLFNANPPSILKAKKESSQDQAMDLNDLTLEVHEEEIEFFGDPKLESMVRFNGDFEQVSVNMLDTYSVFDSLRQGARMIKQSIVQVEQHNSAIHKRQDNLEVKFNELESILFKIKELKGLKLEQRAQSKYEPITQVQQFNY